MEFKLIQGVKITELKIINNNKGNILHALKASEQSFVNFGEAYFTEINYEEIKGWKKHHKMILNFIVPIGNIEFFLIDKRKNSNSFNKYFKIVIGKSNYSRLTIPPNIWVAFKGLDNNNILLNIANIEHDINESENLNLDYFNVF